jgi:gamma-glutamyltranspeptidase/glutathione hydrolase
MRRAYQDRAAYLGDPDFVEVPIQMLISSEHAIEHSESIDLTQATPIHLDDDQIFVSNKGTEITHFSIVDLEGNRVATTQTINTWFGSGYMVPSGGFILNNEMDDFSAKPFTPNRYGLVHGEANSIHPNKRMLSSMTPTFIESDAGTAILGTPGGSKIITMVLLSILNWTNGGTANEMTSIKRFHHQYLPDTIQYEKGAFSERVVDELTDMGHKLKEIRDYGNMQVITIQKDNGKVETSSDPRALIEDSGIDYY